MKKFLIWLLLIFSSVGFAVGQLSAEMVFSNQVITVKPSQLSVEAVRYSPSSVTTNTGFVWVESEQVVTNGLFAGGGIVTNTVSVQQPITTVVTNTAAWTASVNFALPRGYMWSLNGIPVTIDRFSTKLEIIIDPADVQSVFGASYDGLLFAAQTGNYQPIGQTRDGFLGLAAQRLFEAGE
jgi:hypothetical protein